MIIDVVPFVVLAGIAVVAACAMVFSQNAVHAAMFLVINLGTIAVLYLTLNAPFLAMVQIAVYAGAIMVLFLFVIMLLGAEKLGTESRLQWQRPVAFVLVGTLFGTGVVLYVDQLPSAAAPAGLPADSAPRAVAELLFSSYLLPFEITSVLLLAALIGAVVLTMDRKAKGR